MPIFTTLGPAGSNHELVARRYLAFHDLDQTDLVLIDDFNDALVLIAGGKADYAIQAAAHFQTPEIVAKAFFRHRIFAVDTFIAPSRALGILTRAECHAPRTLALQPATRDYADTSRWPEIIEEPTTVAVAEGLLAGRYDSGLTALDLAAENPDRFTIDVEIGSVDDPWIVYGRTRTATGGLVAWRNGPAGRLYRR